MVTRAVVGATRRDVLAGGIGLYAAGLLSPFLFPQALAEAASHAEGTRIMSTIKTKDGTEIFYKDWGPRDAQAIVFHHGWPLSADDWDAQMLF
ncbi:haloperoxidase, partial [alpha proteobacterium AAP38]